MISRACLGNLNFGEEFKGQQDREPLRGKSASERTSEKEGFQRFSEGFQRVFRGPLRDPVRGRFPSQRLSVLLPLIVLPLETPTKTCDPDGLLENRFRAFGPK